MKTHVEIKRVQTAIVRTFALLLLFLMGAPAIPAQAPPNQIPAAESIPSGSLVIPMDNVNQGNAAGTTFNLRAYGLANQLLQNGIPVKWVIKPNKSKDDIDFSADVTKIAQSGPAGPASGSLSFAGGPFVVSAQYDTQALRNIISNFNGGPGTAVTVYQTTADTSADVRYTLTHKPKIAIGPDGGNFGTGVFQGLFDRAGIGNYTIGINNIDNQGACYTLATQAHQEDPQFVNAYRQFTNAGGNLILQCASINTFENNLNGHFQTTGAGYNIFTSNGQTPNELNSNDFVFPEGSMPFNQFLGLLADQDGQVTEYSYAPGAGPNNGNRISVRNNIPNENVFVATVSEVLGPNQGGGVVFELGGHNYARPDENPPGTPNESDSALAMLNGQRMGLNAVFVPARTICTQTPNQTVVGYKSVRKVVDFQPGGPPLTPGDTVEWTIDYINLATSQTNQLNFQIQDVINEFNQHLIFVPYDNPNPPVAVSVYGGATASANPSFTGSGAGTSLDLLAPGAFVPVGGRVRVKLKTQIAPGAPVPYDLFNQTTARSDSLLPTALTKSDAVDANNAGIFDEDPPAGDSIGQVQNGSIIDPTKVHIVGAPTAANVSVEGRVIDQRGAGIANALVSIVDGSSGEVYSTRTNSLGFFRVDSLEAGGFYLISVSHKRYRFPGGPTAQTIGDDMTGLTFVGRLPETKNGRDGTISTVKSGSAVKSSKTLRPIEP